MSTKRKSGRYPFGMTKEEYDERYRKGFTEEQKTMCDLRSSCFGCRYADDIDGFVECILMIKDQA